MSVIYIHRIEQHDLTHQFGLRKIHSRDFFELDSEKSYDGIRFQHLGQIYLGKHLGATDPRLGGGFNDILRRAAVREGDYVIFQKERVPPYEISITERQQIVGKRSYAYQFVVDVGNSRHCLIDLIDAAPPSTPLSSPPNVNRLTIALKMFDDSRKENPKFHQTEDSAREWFKDFTEEKLKHNFEYFQSKMIWAGMVRAQITKDYDHVDELAKLLGELKTNPQTVEYYVSADFRERLKTECPGMGRTTVFDMLMKMHPESYGAYNGMMKDSLVFLGLLPEKSGDKITPEIYRRVMGIYEAIRERMREMKIGLHPEGDYEPPDFLVINEFLWFINECKDLIKEKIMKLSEKKVEKKPRTGERTLKDAANDPLMQRLMAALRTKPFAILAGHSGTGKSRMVRRLAYMTCNDEGLLKEAEKSNAPGNYCMVQVKPNWHDSTDLIGYYSELDNGYYHTTPFVEFVAKAYAYPETPFFVCLDEMNLAPVEHYFAEYLSAIESRDSKTGLTDALIPNTYEANEIMPHELFADSVKEFKEHGLTIPRNLFVVGTVNMDETTHQFSRKVLDRAMTILMDEVDFASMSSGVEPSDEQLLDSKGIEFFLKAAENVKFDDAALLTDLNMVLKDTPFVIAYRFAKEFSLYKEAIAKLDENATAATALDHMVLMKLLPRIHGEKESVRHIFEGKDGKTGIKSVVGVGLSQTQMESILARSDEYLTFWP